jgi:hypothetical protein
MQLKRYAKKSVGRYFKWISGFIRFRNNQHPSVLFDQHIEQYISHLVNQRKPAANTQLIALNSKFTVGWHWLSLSKTRPTDPESKLK